RGLGTFLPREAMNVITGADTLAKSGLQISRPSPLSQEAAKSRGRQGLKSDSFVARQQGDRLPGLIVESNALSRHPVLEPPQRQSVPQYASLGYTHAKSHPRP